jgi:phospholipase C
MDGHGNFGGIAPKTFVAAGLLCVGLALTLQPGYAGDNPSSAPTTPIKHLVVIYQENVSFDHYFATYPVALNPKGEPSFVAAANTPTVNGLGTLVRGLPTGGLLTDNPNANNPGNGAYAVNPFRLDRSQVSTCDQDHSYGPEQQAFNQGLMNTFPAAVGNGPSSGCAAKFAYGKGQGLVMGYFDGNSVTALWNYAQKFAMSDNYYDTTFGPSSLGALHLVAGTTYPAMPSAPSTSVVPDNAGPGTLVADLDPTGDVCSGTVTVRLGGSNVGDLLNKAGVTWGAFMGGFNLAIKNANGSTGCARSTRATVAVGGAKKDYTPHHAWFQYFASTRNPAHTRPSSLAAIGTAHDGGANHQYDLNDFFDALAAGNMPAVSILKAIAADDGHAGYSDPLLEQTFLVNTINKIMNSPFWPSTAIVITYDDSDGWYDHQMSPIVNPSAVAAPKIVDADALNAPGICGEGAPLEGVQGRCGYGPRLPIVVISPFAKINFVDHTVTDQTSVLRFIEDNWKTGRIGGGSFDAIAGPITNMFDFSGVGIPPTKRRLILNPSTGEPG